MKSEVRLLIAILHIAAAASLGWTYVTYVGEMGAEGFSDGFALMSGSLTFIFLVLGAYNLVRFIRANSVQHN